jgi:hypothetical protein
VGWFGWRVECDVQADLDVPAGDANVFDVEAQQLLFFGVVEGVDDGVDAGGEVVHAGSELIVAGEGGTFVSEAGSVVLQLFSACGDLGGAARHFGEIYQAGLVEVDEAAPFGVGGVDLAVQLQSVVTLGDVRPWRWLPPPSAFFQPELAPSSSMPETVRIEHLRIRPVQ